MSDHGGNEVRREAFRAAAVAVDRFLERVGAPMSEEANDISGAARDRFRSELARVVDLNLDMVRNALGLYGTLIGPESFDPGESGRLVFTSGVPGSEAVAVLWLHNFDDDPMTDIGLVGSKLSIAGGEAIGEPGWSFTPSPVSVPARSAVPVLVKVAIPSGVDGGAYEGTITATGGRGQHPIEVLVDIVTMDPVAHDSW